MMRSGAMAAIVAIVLIVIAGAAGSLPVGMIGLIVTGTVFCLYGVIAIYDAYMQMQERGRWRSWWPPDVMISFGIPMVMIGIAILFRPMVDTGVIPDVVDWDTWPGAIYRIAMAAASVHFLIVLRGGGFRRGR